VTLIHVVAGVLAVGVVIAGFVLWRETATASARWMRRARWLIAGLAVYGAAAFIQAAATGTPVRELLSAHGLHQMFPYALRGAFIGAFVVLPLGWIVSVIRVGISRFRGRPERQSWFQAVALTTCIAVLLPSLDLPRSGGAAAGPTVRISPAERTVLLDKSLRALEDGDREMARDTWDPDYVVSRVGRDPQKLFAWVRDNTYWIPYHGVLRGPVGVLMDRQGNSLDRAILLAVLLQRAGHTVRLAHGDLPRDQVLELLPRLEVNRTLAFASQEPSEASQPNIRLAAAQYHIDAAAINNNLQSWQQTFSQIASELRSRVADQTNRLLKLVTRPDSVDVWARSYGAAMGSLSDHWWVQLQNGPNWVDLDLFAPNGRPGMALATAKETPAISDLPGDLHHTVTIRVIAEQWSAGALREHKVLEQVLRPSDLIGHSVMLQFWPSEWLDPEKPALQPPNRARAVAQEEWDAVLAVDRSVLQAGLLLDTGDDPDAPVKGGELGGLAGAFASTMGLNHKSDNRQLSAVWIDYEIHVPGEKARIIRRTAFDLLGPAARATPSPTLALDNSKRLTRSLALTMKTEILPVACGLSPEFVTALLTHNLHTDRDLLTFLIKGDLPAGTHDIEQLLNRSEAPLSTLYGLALMRLELSQKRQVFIDRPNILSRHLYPVPSGEGVAFLDSTDIVANEVGVGLAVQDPFAAHLAQGVLDTNAESLFQPRRNVSLSAGDALAASRSWMAFTSAEGAAALRKLSLPEDVRRQISNDLNAGYAVVAPEKAVSVDAGEFAGWWRIDRMIGDALGLGANGWGATMPERGAKEAQTARIAPLWKARIKMFTVAFAANYGWCFVPLVFDRASDYKKQHPHLGYGMALWEGAVKPSVGECTGDSIYIAGLTAWLLPVGVAEGDPRAAERGQSFPNDWNADPKAPLKPPTKGGKPTPSPPGPPKGGNPPDEPGGPHKGEPNPEPKPEPPKKNDPCDAPGDGPTQPQPEAPEAPSEPQGATPLNQQLLDAQRDVYTAGIANKQATEAFMEALGAEYRYRAGPEWRGGAPFDPAKYQELQNIAAREDQIANQRFQELRLAERTLQNVKDSIKQANRRPQQSGLGCGPGGAPSPKPEPISSLDPSLYQAPQSGGTEPGLGPSYADPTLDPNGPPTVPDRVQIPGDSNNPYAPTLPGDNPNTNTQSGAPSNTPPNQTPSAPPPQSWDGKPCSWCSTVAPVYPDSPSSDSKSQSSPQNSSQQASPGQNTRAGLGGAMSALGGGPK
jgi:hypothetical protein